MTFRTPWAWLAIVAAGVLAIYLPGLGNELVFDDLRLADGSLDKYRAFDELRVRLLSYGSFPWLAALLGDGWWKQRLVNLLLHLATVAALFAFWREVLACLEGPKAEPGQPAPVPYAESPALAFAVGFFALNPAAVYGVAYLVQRSILMATLFTVLALWLFVKGVRESRPGLHAAALALYVLAILSKEHALLAPLAALPLYVVAARPAPARLAAIGAATAALAVAAGLFLYVKYGAIIGKPFDEFSHVFLAQLAALDPAAAENAWGLSVLNQCWLFFEYGVRWLVPWGGWMSINLRPPFPIAWLTFPHVLGVAGYLAVLAAGAFLVLRHRDWRALVGLSLLLPAILFASEFATVWVQDPFVIYRSYLWAIGVPGLAFFLAYGPGPKALAGIAVAVAAFLGWQSLDRVFSLRSPEAAYTDAIAKLPDDPRAVGRWYPYLNRGNHYFDRGQEAAALRDFEASSYLGDMGMGAQNVGAMLAGAKRHAEALAAFDRAEKQGYTLYNLHFQRGLSLVALGRLEEAWASLVKARDLYPPSPTRELLYAQLGRVALQTGRKDEAIKSLAQLVAFDPKHKEARYLLGMAYVQNNQHALALQILDTLVADDPKAPPGHYARAVALYGLKRKADALAAIDTAIALDPANPGLREWQAKIRTLP